jgi:hypothetical protein
MAQKLEERRPIVIAVQCNTYRRNYIDLVLNSPLAVVARGCEADVVGLDFNKPEQWLWWVNPTDREFLIHLLLNVRTKLSHDRALEWFETPQFVSYVRREIIMPSLHGWAQGRAHAARFDSSFAQAVRAVVFSDCFFTDSLYVRRIFDGFFPNAAFFQVDVNGRHIDPVWTETLEERRRRVAPEVGALALVVADGGERAAS